MIEQYEDSYKFLPTLFNTFTQKEQILHLENFIDFLSKEFKLPNCYQLELSMDIGTDIARHSVRNGNHKILLSKQIFDKYQIYISNPNSLDKKLVEQLKLYPFQLCSAILHEMKHAEQYKLYKNELNTLYENVAFPISNEMLYILQKTEREAFQFETNEMKLLYLFFKQNNLLTYNEENDLLKLFELQKADIDFFFEESIKILSDNKLIKKDKKINFENYEEKTKIYNKTQELIKRETEFVKERNDYLLNQSEYITRKININMLSYVEYRIKNDNGKWLVQLELMNRNKLNDVLNPQIYFSLDNEKCKINKLLLEDCLNNNGLNPKELLKYMNAIIELYHTKVSLIQISDFAFNMDYKQTLEFAIKNTTNFLKNKFVLRPSVFNNDEYENVLNNIKNDLTIDNLIKLNQSSQNVSSKIEIIR